MTREQFTRDEIQRAKASADTVALFEQDGSVVERDGSGHRTCCPFHDDRSPSLHIYPDGGFKCFGCGAMGDVFEYLQRRRGLNLVNAMEALGHQAPRKEPAKIDQRREYDAILPVPAKAPRFNGRQPMLGEPVKTWEYRSATGDLLMIDARYQFTKDGKAKKAVKTWTWARNAAGEQAWHPTQPAKDIPLYGLDRLAKAPADATVLMVEGCKTADAAQQAFPAMVAMTWCGGAQKTKKPWHDLTPLRGRHVILLPDCDRIGAYAMAWLARHLRELGCTVQVISLVGLDVAEGWDIADGENPAAWSAQLLARLVEPEVTDAALRSMMRELNGTIDQKLADEILGPGAPAVANAMTDAANDAQKTGDSETPPPASPDLGARGDDADDDVERGDIANASRFIRQHRHHVRYCPVYGRWHVWTGQVWQPGLSGKAADNTVMPLAEQTARDIASDLLDESREAFTAAKEAEKEEKEWEAKNLKARGARLAAKAEQIQGLTKLQNMLALAKTRVEICIEPTDLDSHAHLLTVQNGTIDLRTGRLLAHNPDWLLTQISPCEFDPEARSQILDRVIRHVMQTDEVIEFGQLVLGRSIFGDNSLEKFYIWQGPGRSGKGTLLEALKCCLGSSVMTAEFKTFITSQGRQVRDDLARLAEARVVLASEVGKGEHLDPTVIKSITGLDTITSRHLYGSYFEFRPRLTLHLQCNDLPRVDDQDDAIWNRLVVIPCGPTLPEAQRDPAVKAHLFDPEKGGKALLAWIVAGAIKAAGMRYLPEPAAVKAKSVKYRSDNNPVKAFIADDLRVAHEANREATWCAVADLLKAYHAHCDLAFLDRRYRMSEQRLAERIEALGAYRKKKRVLVEPTDPETKTCNVWIGVTLARTDHMAHKQPTDRVTFMPSEPEHLNAIGAVPVPDGAVPMFPSYPTLGNSAGAHPRTHLASGDFQNRENIGTEEQKKNDQEPSIDLSDLTGGQ